MNLDIIKSLKDAIGCDEIYQSANHLGVSLVFNVEVSPSNVLAEDVPKSIRNRLDNSNYFKIRLSEYSCEIEELRQKLELAHKKIEDLEKYKTFYELYKNLQK